MEGWKRDIATSNNNRHWSKVVFYECGVLHIEEVSPGKYRGEIQIHGFNFYSDDLPTMLDIDDYSDFELLQGKLEDEYIGLLMGAIKDAVKDKE